MLGRRGVPKFIIAASRDRIISEYEFYEKPQAVGAYMDHYDPKGTTYFRLQPIPMANLYSGCIRRHAA